MKNLSNKEKEILEVMCELQKPVTAKELLGIFADRGTDWKIQTISTLLTRMEQKDAVQSELIKHVKYYSPRYNSSELSSIEAKRFIKDVFRGSLSDFFVALTDGAISDDKAKELEQWLSEQEGK